MKSIPISSVWMTILGILTVSSSAHSYNFNFSQIVRVKSVQSVGGGKISPDIVFDKEIYSPKSVAFSPDGKKIYINSLEGNATLVYSWPELKKLKSIHHRFDAQAKSLFRGETTTFGYKYFQPVEDPNQFVGKPVEMSFSHAGKFLWVTYYRRSFDQFGQSPSAVAIIDTKLDQIVRVMPTGPIPKFVTVSQDQKRVAITHWGDNTLGLIDISTGRPEDFRYESHLVVERQMNQAGLFGANRDKICGFCLRGTVFSPDSKFLFVARMTGNGIAGFDVATGKYLGTVSGMAPSPRHLVITNDQKNLVMSNNASGFVTKIGLSELVRVLLSADRKTVTLNSWSKVEVGAGARTLELSQDSRTAFVAVNNSVSLVAVDLETMTVKARIRAEPYPVGLALSKEGNRLAVTSQGRAGKGGNKVTIYELK